MSLGRDLELADLKTTSAVTYAHSDAQKGFDIKEIFRSFHIRCKPIPTCGTAVNALHVFPVNISLRISCITVLVFNTDFTCVL